MLPELKKQKPVARTDALRAVAPSLESDPEVLARLRTMCEERGLDGLADNLVELMAIVGPDLMKVETELKAVTGSQRAAEKAGDHLLALGGKRLRPLCVALSSRVGSGFDQCGLDLAVAVELVHNATLLHDDVIDMAQSRRGAKAARIEFGNAASIFAGDWLLIDALKRVQRAGVPETLVLLLDTIAEMIRAESLQLEMRGRLDLSRETYFEIAEGKSATLFRWAMGAGARVGGLGLRVCEALESYGGHLGVAFQVIDDVLDLSRDARTGKARFTDLREGKLTFPVITALERDPTLWSLLEPVVTLDPLDEPDLELLEQLAERFESLGALDHGRQVAAERVERAVAALDALPSSTATTALAAVATSTVHRLL